MDTIKLSKEIDDDRRRFVNAAAAGIAAAGALSLFPKALHAAVEDREIRPFRVNVPKEALADLRRRIAATKWPNRETVADATQGVQLATMRELARYWETKHDWRKIEARLNSYPQFMTDIDGVESRPGQGQA